MSGPHANARDPWRCPYCGATKTVAARPGHLRASEACRAAHASGPDWRATVAFTHLPPEEQAAIWAESEVGLLVTVPEPDDARPAPAPPEPKRDPEPDDPEPGGGPEPEPADGWDGFLAD